MRFWRETGLRLVRGIEPVNIGTSSRLGLWFHQKSSCSERRSVGGLLIKRVVKVQFIKKMQRQKVAADEEQ